MQLKDIIAEIESFAPPVLQEEYDNAGLIFGFPDMEINAALLSLDCTEKVIDEAIQRGCNLVISHHPIVFKGIKSLTGRNYVERTLLKAIKNDIAIYAAHTNLDNVFVGVNKKIAKKIGLTNLKILSPKNDILYKLVNFVPASYVESVRNALFEAGVGGIGHYDECSFSVSGKGTFRAGEDTNAFVGEKGQRHTEQEERIEVILPHYLLAEAINTLKEAHPYEEVAYDVYALQQEHNEVGSGMIGELAQSMDEKQFLRALKRKMNVKIIRHTDLRNKKIKKVALCGGAGSFLLKEAIAQGADIYVSADFKYHEFFDAENQIIIADIGHFESEQFTPEIFSEIFNEKFPNFVTHLCKTNTNPINYL